MNPLRRHLIIPAPTSTDKVYRLSLQAIRNMEMEAPSPAVVNMAITNHPNPHINPEIITTGLHTGTHTRASIQKGRGL